MNCTEPQGRSKGIVSVLPSKNWRNRVLFVTTGTAIAWISGALCATVGNPHVEAPCIFTETTRYDPTAWLDGRDRFPDGATLKLIKGGTRRGLVRGFYATADAETSYDGRRVLFSGKLMASDPWQIWEVALEGGTPRLVSSEPADCLRPLYLPDGQIVYTRVGSEKSEIAIAGKPLTRKAE